MSGARLDGDRFSDGETRVMDLWDSGLRDQAAIAAKTGYSRSYVDSIVGRYSLSERVLSSFDRMSAAGTASLLSAMHVFHPETRRGIHP